MTRNMNAIAPDNHAAAKRRGNEEAIPTSENFTACRRIADRIDRHAGKGRQPDDPVLSAHPGAPWTIRRNNGDLPSFQGLQHLFDGCRCPLAGGTPHTVLSPVTDGAGNDFPITMVRNHHIHLGFLLYRNRHHQKAAMPKRQDEGFPSLHQLMRGLSVHNLPAAGAIDEPYIARGKQASGGLDRVAFQYVLYRLQKLRLSPVKITRFDISRPSRQYQPI